MIEHVSHAAGARLAAEVHRVLRPGGVFRVATPDLATIAQLVLPQLDERARKYIATSNQLFGKPDDTPAVVVNRVLRWWGHEFVYDEATLRQLLSAARFSNVMRCTVGQSDHSPLRELEDHGDVVGREMNAFETTVLEATKLA